MSLFSTSLVLIKKWKTLLLCFILILLVKWITQSTKALLLRGFIVQFVRRDRCLSKLSHFTLFNWFLTLGYLYRPAGCWAASLQPEIFLDSRGCQLGVSCSSTDLINRVLKVTQWLLFVVEKKNHYTAFREEGISWHRKNWAFRQTQKSVFSKYWSQTLVSTFLS